MSSVLIIFKYLQALYKNIKVAGMSCLFVKKFLSECVATDIHAGDHIFPGTCIIKYAVIKSKLCDVRNICSMKACLPNNYYW